ncbi:MAG: dihydrolipoamide acetyltransferase family protein [Clostridia bacterium]|nr:dihydrolipoamide acetyltransferase family protein [Clostridia bacterium]
MVEKLKMPMLGETMDSGVINKWIKKEGDFITKGDPICEIQTDKVAIEFESNVEGTLLKIVAEPGEELPIGAVIAYLGEEGDEIPEEEEVKEEVEQEVKEEAKEEVVEKETVPVEQPKQPVKTVARKDGERIFISPRARKYAQEHGIDYSNIAGSGPNGRIVEQDVIDYQKAAPAAAPAQKQVADKVEVPVAPEDEVIEMDNMRKIIARRMAESIYTAPHFYATMEIDMTQVKEIRAKINQSLADQGTKVSFNDIVIKACTLALKKYPYMNSSMADDQVVLHKDINVGVAVALETGLIVPVIRNADKLSLAEIADQSKELVDKAKNNKLMPEDYKGGTFTVSNLGMFGIDQFTAIINQPESAILAVGGIADKFVPVDGQPVVKSLMKVTLSSDHRVIDGATAANFLKYLKTLLENPFMMI